LPHAWFWSGGDVASLVLSAVWTRGRIAEDGVARRRRVDIRRRWIGGALRRVDVDEGCHEMMTERWRGTSSSAVVRFTRALR